MNKQRIVDQLRSEAMAGGFANFESMDWEEMYNFHLSKGVAPSQAALLANAGSRKGMPNGQGMGGFTRGGTVGNPQGERQQAAQLTINVVRNTADLAAALPYVLFGKMASLNGYRRILNGLLPTGITLTSVDVGESDGQPEALVFAFTDGVDTDTVTVQTQAAPYPSVLDSTITDIIAIDRMRLSISDTAQVRQFDSDLFVRVSNMWGTLSARSLNPQSFRSPEQFQNAILDINVGVNIDKETMIQGTILSAVGFTVSHGLFVRSFEAWKA